MSAAEARPENGDSAIVATAVALDDEYELKRCANWINTNHYQKVCLQFPDHLLGDAIAVQNQLERYIDADLYVSADATFRSCCLDLKTAKHVNADALIHFGRTCSSRFHSNSTASLYILPKEYLNVNVFVDRVTRLIDEKRCNVVLLYDVAFDHYVGELECRLAAFRSSINLSRLLVNADNEACESTDDVGTIVKKLGRRYSVDFPDCNRTLCYVYIISASDRKNFENFLLSLPENTFYTYDSRCDVLSVECVPKTIKRTLFQVEKVKQARRVGILVATLEALSFLDAVRRIKKLCASKGKKTYIISVGKPNVAKLANFPEIDLFVMISCPEVELADRKDYFQTIVSAVELELALNDNYRWTGRVVADFGEFLPGGSEYKPVHENDRNSEQSCDDGGGVAQISLLDNRSIELDGDAVSVIQSSDVVSTVDRSQYCLANRSWTGLQTRMDDRDIPAATATVGRKGAPAAGYRTPFADRVT